MNSLQDFNDLNLPLRKKQDVALALGLWNSANESGEVKLDAIHRLSNYEAQRKYLARCRRLARQLGLKIVS